MSVDVFAEIIITSSVSLIDILVGIRWKWKRFPFDFGNCCCLNGWFLRSLFMSTRIHLCARWIILKYRRWARGERSRGNNEKEKFQLPRMCASLAPIRQVNWWRKTKTKSSSPLLVNFVFFSARSTNERALCCSLHHFILAMYSFTCFLALLLSGRPSAGWDFRTFLLWRFAVIGLFNFNLCFDCWLFDEKCSLPLSSVRTRCQYHSMATFCSGSFIISFEDWNVPIECRQSNVIADVGDTVSTIERSTFSPALLANSRTFLAFNFYSDLFRF